MSYLIDVGLNIDKLFGVIAHWMSTQDFKRWLNTSWIVWLGTVISSNTSCAQKKDHPTWMVVTQSQPESLVDGFMISNLRAGPQNPDGANSPEHRCRRGPRNWAVPPSEASPGGWVLGGWGRRLTSWVGGRKERNMRALMSSRVQPSSNVKNNGTLWKNWGQPFSTELEGHSQGPL